MIVVCFKIQCAPEAFEGIQAAMAAVIGPSRALDGVVSFDIGQDISDPNGLIATEVFEDRDALDRQEAQEEVARVMELLGAGLAAEPEATIFHVSSSEPHTG